MKEKLLFFLISALGIVEEITMSDIIFETIQRITKIVA